jgi:hypothetical protein
MEGELADMPATKTPALRRATASSRRLPMLRVIDGRSAEAIHIKRTRDAIIASLPEPVSEIAVQLAERYAVLAMHLSVLDKATLTGGALTPSQVKAYLGMSGQMQRLLRQIHGLKATKGPSGTSTSLISQLAASA